MSSSLRLSDVERELARTAPLINVKLVDGALALNVPKGELYWAVRDRDGTEYLSPEAAIAQHRGVRLEYAAARGHTIPWADATPDDWLLVGGADSHKDNVELARITDAVAAWLGYTNRFKYAEACHSDPAEVARRIKAAV
jgi:hypothetical protein